MNAWAITAYNNKLDACGFWLSDEEAASVVELPVRVKYSMVSDCFP